MAAFDIELAADTPLPQLEITGVGKVSVVPHSMNVTTYRQRAYNTALSQFVYWTTLGYPDTSGATSGYPPSDLTGITVMTQTP